MAYHCGCVAALDSIFLHTHVWHIPTFPPHVHHHNGAYWRLVDCCLYLPNQRLPSSPEVVVIVQ